VIDKPAPGDERIQKIIIPDTTPISLLGALGELDWLFVPGCELWITDMVMDEATRDPGEDKDRRTETRSHIASWITQNRHRIKRLTTPEGERYRRDMAAYERAAEVWRMAGRPAGLEPQPPDWSDRGEASVLRAVTMADRVLTLGEGVVVLADDRDARAALRLKRADIDLMGTQTFTRWMAEDFHIPEAETAWATIALLSDFKADPGDDEDPVYIRNRRRK
jgi:hypothetical protein